MGVLLKQSFFKTQKAHVFSIGRLPKTATLCNKLEYMYVIAF